MLGDERGDVSGTEEANEGLTWAANRETLDCPEDFPVDAFQH